VQRHIRLVIAGIVLFGLVASIAERPVDAMSLKQLRDKLQAASRNIKAYQSKLKPIKRRQKVATVQVYAAQRRLGVHRAKLSDIRGQLAQTRSALDQARDNLRLVEARLKRRNQLLSARLVDTYKHGSVSYVSVLLGSDDLWELLSRGYVIRKVLDSDVDLVESIKQDKRAVERYKATLEQKERERADLERQQSAVTQASLHDTRQKRYLLQEIEKDRALYEQAVAEELRASNSIGAMIRRMQSTPAGQKRVANPWKGSFMCPITASYRLSSRFGWRIHPIHHVRSFHSGVDMACPEGTPIRAAAGGVVVFAGYHGGVYGPSVLIDHGGGISTFYGHCSRVLVSSGSTVKKGQTIAKVGTEGTSTGPHLHFEKRRNGESISPM
jgi:murein DD-endopeptidase MepM/ murein hydrolase activator NlpD